MDNAKHIVFIKGKDKTEQIERLSYSSTDGKVHVKYFGEEKTYRYHKDNVKYEIDPEKLKLDDVKIYLNDKELFSVVKIVKFKSYYRIFYKIHEKITSKAYLHQRVRIEHNALSDPVTNKRFAYLKDVAPIVSLKTEEGKLILDEEYQKLTYIDEKTVLAKYLNPVVHKMEKCAPQKGMIFPFNCNYNQIEAVDNAMKHSISIVEGPPGTGKTNTILNIIANILVQNKTVAVVSGNNAATENVYEKLGEGDLPYQFLAAILGKEENKDAFLRNQFTQYPTFIKQNYHEIPIDELENQQKELLVQVRDLYEKKNYLAQLKTSLSLYEMQKEYMLGFLERMNFQTHIIKTLGKMKSEKLMQFLHLMQRFICKGYNATFILRVLGLFMAGIVDPVLFEKSDLEMDAWLKYNFYVLKIENLKIEIANMIEYFEQNQATQKFETLQKASLKILDYYLAKKYRKVGNRPIFCSEDLWKNHEAFLKEYPIVLSTTHSVRRSLDRKCIYDYVIIDESSQVDLVTGVLALSCAKNAVIVGDLKQLPNVVQRKTQQEIVKATSRHHIDEAYDYIKNSLLESVGKAFPEAPRKLLKEHYRCHPKIIGFCNTKFYDNQLVIMTEDKGEKNVLQVLKTVAGNHARNHYNQRQIDEIVQTILPEVRQKMADSNDIGIIAPYCDQVEALNKELESGFEIKTVHKFQGREKKAIIISTVDNEISKFTDDPNLLNVAVSRAKELLRVVVSNNEANENTNIGQLSKYILYHNCEVIDGRITSIFDLLYKEYVEQRKAYLNHRKKISRYDSENIMYVLLQDILSCEDYRLLHFAPHVPMAEVVRDVSQLTQREKEYTNHHATHLDFVIYHDIDKLPVLVIEVDGYWYHKNGTQQAERDKIKNSVLAKCDIPFLRLVTNQSGEKERICGRLNSLLNIKS